MSVTVLVAEEPVQEVLPGIPEATPTAAPMSPADELALLEKNAREKGMSDQELDELRSIGDCKAQVQTRVQRLHEWHAAH